MSTSDINYESKVWPYISIESSYKEFRYELWKHGKIFLPYSASYEDFDIVDLI